MTINTLDSFLQHLEIPKACELNKPVFKKLFLDNGILDTTDKKCLKDDVNRVRWLYTLKPSTINIAPYNDSVREYPEVAVLQVELDSPNRIGRIAHFINRSIPYPLVLLFTLEADGQTSIFVSLADKRINQADKEKWVLKNSIHSGWISLDDKSRDKAKFIASLKITGLPFTDFWQFYQALMNRVIAINCAYHSGVFRLDAKNNAQEFNSRLEMLRELKKLVIQKTEIANKLKKVTQMGRQVELNTKVKYINDRITEIKSSL